MYACFLPYHSPLDNKLAIVSQLSIFFSLVSSIALTWGPDEDSERLANALVFTLLIPPILAAFYEAGIDVDKWVWNIFYVLVLPILDNTIGKCLKYLARDGPKNDGTKNDETTEARERSLWKSFSRRDRVGAFSTSSHSVASA